MLHKKEKFLSFVFTIMYIPTLFIGLDTLWNEGDFFGIHNKTAGLIILFFAVTLLMVQYVMLKRLRKNKA